MNYKEALDYIHSVNWTFCKPGLERIKALCTALGEPQKKLRFIHVAGTNGKGSTSAMLASILKKAGYTVKNSDFFKIGIPFTLAAVVPAYIYIWLMYGI